MRSSSGVSNPLPGSTGPSRVRHSPWNSSLAERMQHLLEYDGLEHLKDLIICVGPGHEFGSHVYIHKAIVFVSCPVLHQITKTYGFPDSTGQVSCVNLCKANPPYNQLDAMAFKRMIEFMYTDKVKDLEKAPQGEIGSLLELAAIFDMPRLREYCMLLTSETLFPPSTSSPSSSSDSSSTGGTLDWVVVEKAEDPVPSPIIASTTEIDSPSSPVNSPESPPTTSSVTDPSKLTLTIRQRSGDETAKTFQENLKKFNSPEETRRRTRLVASGQPDDKFLRPKSPTPTPPPAASKIADSKIADKPIVTIPVEINTTQSKAMVSTSTIYLTTPSRPLPAVSSTSTNNASLPMTPFQAKIKEQVVAGVRADLEQQFAANLEQLKVNMVAEIKSELTQHLRDGMVTDLRDHLIQDIGYHLENEVRDQVFDDLKQELMGNLRLSIKSGLMAQLPKIVTDVVNSHVMNLSPGGFLSNLKSEIRTSLKDETKHLVPRFKKEIEEEIMANGVEEYKEEVRSQIKTSIQSELYDEFIPNVIQRIKDGVEHDLEDEDENDEKGFKHGLKTQLKTKLGKGVLRELAPHLERQFQDELENEVHADYEFKQELIRDCKTTLKQRVEQEVLGKLKDDLVDKLRDEFSLDVVDAIRNDLY